MFKKILLILIFIALGFFIAKKVYQKEIKDVEIISKQSFKIGCELGILYMSKSNKVDKSVCDNYLIKNNEVLKKLTTKSK